MKKAILVVSFGTSFNETREKTIDVIENDLRNAFPDRDLYRAWTSKIITDKLKVRDGCSIDMPEAALERMKRDGITDVIVQPTFIIPGLEYEYLKEKVGKYTDDFDSIRIGRPLAGSEGDIAEVAGIIAKDISTADGEALVLMGHGVFNGNNEVYLDLERAIRGLGYERVFIGTVEAEPGLEHVMEEVKHSGADKILLTPLLIVSGDHANNDMAGEDEDSWASAFRREGFEVRCLLKGLGEYKGIRDIFVGHALEADRSKNRVNKS